MFSSGEMKDEIKAETVDRHILCVVAKTLLQSLKNLLEVLSFGVQ
jgi:hypothetical protein